jgi:UDP-2-acetamido-2-deoxy-ribo-hexuluronate aminotransferase|tara:strand:- start:613 stop:1743 length:1131 start_codon:yes stop_codon:yes gene_type:complete
MNKIQMVDLKGQYNNIKSEVDKAVIDVIESGQFINGPSVNDFSNNLSKYLGVNHVIPCANGTDALQVALMALDLNPGDEVITTDFTFASSVEVIALLGLKPVLVDVEIDTFNIDFNKIEKAITNKTKAIIPVHLFGQTAEMKKIMDIANKNNLFVIEDNAQAIGSVYRNNNEKVKAGTIGHIGTTSFFPSKNLGCYGDGGAIFTNDDDLAIKMKGLVNHGMYKRYYHDLVGVNSRLDSIQAAILDIKLKNLDQYNSSRRNSAKIYSEKINSKNIIKPIIKYEDDSHVFHQYTLRLINGKRDQMVKFLNENGVPCGIYYPVPLHNQNAYKSKRYIESDFSVTNQICSEVFSLPMHSELSEEQQNFISDLVNEFSLKS